MSREASDNATIAGLNRKLRSWDLVECTEIVPSLDLSHWAFVCESDDLTQAGLWVASVKDQNPWPLVTSEAIPTLVEGVFGAAIARPRWSTDGRWIAFASYEGLPPGEEHRLWAVESRAGSAPKLLYEGVGIIAAYLWSPDASCLAVADSDAGLVIVPLDGTSEAVDVEAMRYPLGENGMAWLDGGRRLLYMNLSPDREGLWVLEMSTGRRQRVMALSQGEVMIPASANVKHRGAWGALRGNMRQRESGAVLYFWPGDSDELNAISLPDVEFDPASCLIPNDDGSLWAFTVWREGQRVPFVVDRLSHQSRALTVPGVLSRMLCWSDDSCRLWVLLYPPGLISLDVGQPAGPVGPTNGSFFLDLTPAELVCLLEILGSYSMLGLATPFDGMAEDEVEELKEEAKNSLISKDYVAVLPDGQVQIDLTVAALVQCCASPEQTWTTTFEATTGERDVRHIHRVRDLIVEDAILSSGLHRLTPLRDRAAVLQRIEQQMHLGRQPAASARPFVLPEEILSRTREVAVAMGEETAVRYLVSAGVAETTAAQFVQALAQPVSNSSISRWSITDGKITSNVEEGIGILEGAAGLWLFHPFAVEGTVRIKVSPADATTALRQIASLLVWEATPSSA